MRRKFHCPVDSGTKQLRRLDLVCWHQCVLLLAGAQRAFALTVTRSQELAECVRRVMCSNAPARSSAAAMSLEVGLPELVARLHAVTANDRRSAAWARCPPATAAILKLDTPDVALSRFDSFPFCLSAADAASVRLGHVPAGRSSMRLEEELPLMRRVQHRA